MQNISIILIIIKIIILIILIAYLFSINNIEKFEGELIPLIATPSPLNQEVNTATLSPSYQEVSIATPFPLNQEVSIATPSPLNQEVSIATPSPLNQEVNTATPSPLNQQVSIVTPSPLNQQVSIATPSPLNQQVSIATPLYQQVNIYNTTCGKSNNNLDIACNIYNTQKILINRFEQDYNSARRNAENKYNLWDFSKNEVSLKRKVLNTAIILRNNINIRNKIQKTLNIINAVVAAKKLVILLNNGYNQSTIAYQNALDEYNKIIIYANTNDNDRDNINLLQINDKNGYSSPSVALDKTINKYNNAVFIAIATNTSKSKNLIPSITNTTDISILINAQIAANDAYNEINDKYIIPTLNIYNRAATNAKMNNYNITDNLSSVYLNAQLAYDNATKSEKTTIALALSNYNDSLNVQLDKLKSFYNEIKDLQNVFYNYCNFLINPEIAYKPSSQSNNYTCNDRYEDLISYLNKISPELNKINNLLSNIREKCIKTPEYVKVEDGKKNVSLIFNYLEKSYLNNIDIIKNSTDFLNKYIDLNTANDIYFKSIISYNETREKQEYDRIVITYIPTIIKYDNINNEIKKCYPDG